MIKQWLCAVASVAVLALNSPALAHEKKDSQAVTPAAAVDAFEAALVKGDEAAVQTLLAPDVLIYESGGQESSRDEYAAHHMKGDMAFLAGSKREVLARSEGGDAQHAYVSTRSRITGRHKEKDVDIISTETIVLKYGVLGWRIVHIHWSSRPASKDH